MALRWRISGELLCAAKHPEMPDDTYIDDRLQYKLDVKSHAILPAFDEEQSGRWYWVCDHVHDTLRAVVKES